MPVDDGLHRDVLDVRGAPDARLVLTVLACGVIIDVATRAGLATISATVAVGIVSIALLAFAGVRGVAGRLILALAPVLAVALTVRSSPWVLVPVVIGVILLVVTGVSFGATGASPLASFPDLAGRIVVVVGHVVVAPGWFRRSSADGHGLDAGPRRAAAVARGAALALPVGGAVGLLLASADPIFKSWFDLSAGFEHAVVMALGAWVVLGLARAAHARRPALELSGPPVLGTVEATCVLGGLCLVYATFVIAQLVALSGGGEHVLATQGLTYATYARTGFFQLLAAAALTLVVLLGLRACTDPTRRLFVGLAETTVVLTIAVVGVAIGRLQLYQDAYGLTMLRLASTSTAVWIGVVFVLLGVAIAGRRSSIRWLAPAILLSALIAVGAWAAADPASLVARVNVQRAADGEPFDVESAVALGPDAVPALVAGLPHLSAEHADQMVRALCDRRSPAAGRLAFNRSITRAEDALATICPDQP